MTWKQWVSIGGMVIFLAMSGWQSCEAGKARARERAAVAVVAGLRADMAKVDAKWSAVVTAKQAEIDAAHVAATEAEGAFTESAKKAKRDIAAIRASAATWEQKFGTLELRYAEDMAAAAKAIEAKAAENRLLVQQIENYRAEALDYKRISEESLDRLAQAVAENVKLDGKYKRARTWAIGATAATAILATAKLAAKK